MAERTRSRFEPFPTARGYSYTLTGTTQHGMSLPPNPLPSGTLSTGNVAQTVEDVVTPNYRALQDQGVIINNPFKSTKTTLTVTPPGALKHTYRTPNGYWCSAHSQYHDLVTSHEGQWRPNTPSRLLMDTALRSSLASTVKSLATTQAFANIDVSEMNALASAAEGRKTVDSMRAISLRALKIMRNVRRLDYRALRNEIKPKELADRYMEARYAIRPLVYDAIGVVNAVKSQRGFVRRTFVGEETRSGTITGSKLADQTLATMILGDWERSINYEISARAGVLCDCQITGDLVFGTNKFAETLWELTPWSFVADWFANTGDWIAAHTPNAGVRQLASWCTVREKITGVHKLVNVRSTANANGFTGATLSYAPSTFTWEELVLTRTIDVGAASTPEFRMKLDEWKLTDLAIMTRRVFS